MTHPRTEEPRPSRTKVILAVIGAAVSGAARALTAYFLNRITD